MNPHTPQPISINSLVVSCYRNRLLIIQMTKREVVGRYKGSVMGLLWSFLNPIFMMAIYTFVFSVVFKAKWGIGGDESQSQFAIMLFVGMIVHGLFAEVLNRAPNLILSNVNYVKKVIFPLDILPIISIGVAVFHSLVGLLVLLIAFFLINGYLNWSIIFTPFILLPLLIFTLGFAYMLASLGVYLRDVGQFIGMIMTLLLFCSPVFYPITALPEKYQIWMMANPITFIIEQARAVIIMGQVPNWIGLFSYTLVAVFTAWIGYVWFQKTRKGFADVL